MYAVETFQGVEVQLHSFLTSVSGLCHVPGGLGPRKGPPVPTEQESYECQSLSDVMEEKDASTDSSYRMNQDPSV